MSRATVELPLDLHRLAAIGELLHAVCPATDPRDAVAAFELALHEVAVNVLRHAGATGPVRITIERTAHGLWAEIVDDGRPFALTDAPIVQPGELREHGYGLLLVRQLVDEVSVTRAGGRNHWRLHKEMST